MTKDVLAVVEDRLMLVLETQAQLSNVLDVLEVGRIDKAIEHAKQGLIQCRKLHEDLNSERKLLRNHR